jgi:hypothetical protein
LVLVIVLSLVSIFISIGFSDIEFPEISRTSGNVVQDGGGVGLVIEGSSGGGG